MLTLDVMERIDISPVPYGQIAAASLIIGPNYAFPPTRTKVTIEGYERIPTSGRVYLAMNHTDRFNYFPFQYTAWRNKPSMYTATWVKGKYFNSGFSSWFLLSTNNIPTPSRGYLITSDAVSLLNAPPDDQTYRMLRDALDEGDHDTKEVRARARAHGVSSQVEMLLQTPRDMLGVRFDPLKETYFEAMERLFERMMSRFIELNLQAFDHGHKVLVFPEGTRSLTLAKGRPGLAQMALRTGATIVPIGCNGSELLYPGDSPISKGGEVVYRVGEPITPDGELAPYVIDEPYTPFTKEAEHLFGPNFQAVTDIVMERIAELVDPRYLPGSRDSTAVSGANRFL